MQPWRSTLIDPATTRVEVPFGDTTLPAYFHNASTDGEPVPAMILCNGLDCTKEHMYTSGFAQEFAARGISTLMVDCPGSGEALRLQGLTAQVDTEEWAAACVDYLLTRDDVRADRIGLVGWSLGGYYAPRAAAFEKRLALCVAWGANHDWGAVQKRRLEREGENPVPHYWDHVLWVWGEDDLDTLHRAGRGRPPRRRRRADHRAVPDRPRRERPADPAASTPTAPTTRRSTAPKRELRIFTPEEGATEHIGLDHFPHVQTFIADWVADTFAGLCMDAGLDRATPRARSPRPRRGSPTGDDGDPTTSAAR